MVPTMFGVMLLVFVLFNWVGGDPAYILAGKFSSPEQIRNIREQLGLDRSQLEQFGIFVRQVATGDFGASWVTNEPVSRIFATRLGPSLTVLVPMLMAYSTAGAMCISSPCRPNQTREPPAVSMSYCGPGSIG